MKKYLLCLVLLSVVFVPLITSAKTTSAPSILELQTRITALVLQLKNLQKQTPLSTVPNSQIPQTRTTIGTPPPTGPVVNNLNIPQVTGLQAVDLNMGGRVLLTWNEMPREIGAVSFAVYRKQANSSSAYQNVASSDGNIVEDRFLTNNISYTYKIVPINAPNSIDEASNPVYTPEQITTSVSVTPTSGKDIHTEDVVFVIEKQYAAQHPDYQNQMNKLLAGVNAIYAKNTVKQFRLKAIKLFDATTACDFSLATNPCANLEARKDYYLPGAITIFFGKLPISLGDGFGGISFSEPTYRIIIKTCSQLDAPSRNPDGTTSTCDWYNDGKLGFIWITTHELAHTFGVATPEYYASQNKIDQSGVAPIFPSNEILPTEYLLDPMVSNNSGDDLGRLIFGPLSTAIINANYNRQKSSNLYTTLQSIPRRTRVLVKDQSGTPLTGADVKVFCIGSGSFGTQVNEQNARQQFITDNLGYSTLQLIIVGDEFMTESNLNVFDFNCTTNLLKIYKTGYTPIVIPVTFLQMQLEKILRNNDDYTINATLSKSTDTQVLSSISFSLPPVIYESNNDPIQFQRTPAGNSDPVNISVVTADSNGTLSSFPTYPLQSGVTGTTFSWNNTVPANDSIRRQIIATIGYTVVGRSNSFVVKKSQPTNPPLVSIQNFTPNKPFSYPFRAIQGQQTSTSFGIYRTNATTAQRVPMTIAFDTPVMNVSGIPGGVINPIGNIYTAYVDFPAGATGRSNTLAYTFTEARTEENPAHIRVTVNDSNDLTLPIIPNESDTSDNLATYREVVVGNAPVPQPNNNPQPNSNPQPNESPTPVTLVPAPLPSIVFGDFPTSIQSGVPTTIPFTRNNVTGPITIYWVSGDNGRFDQYPQGPVAVDTTGTSAVFKSLLPEINPTQKRQLIAAQGWKILGVSKTFYITGSPKTSMDKNQLQQMASVLEAIKQLLKQLK